MNLSVWLRLGRVSNLPTVWTNVLAALALSGAFAFESWVLLLCLSFSLFYVGGMYLNDAFDRHIDAAERPNRPIPSGQVSASLVFTLGFGLLALGLGLLTWVAKQTGASALYAGVSGLALAAAIVGYNLHHKQNPLSPLLMGMCRVLVYVGTAFAVRRGLSHALVAGALGLLCHLIGLSYAAKQEVYNRLSRTWPLWSLAAPLLYAALEATREPVVWPFLLLLIGWEGYTLRFLLPGPRRAVPQAIVRLIAAIALLDAVFIASAGVVQAALVAVALAGLTRLLQRYIPGT